MSAKNQSYRWYGSKNVAVDGTYECIMGGFSKAGDGCAFTFDNTGGTDIVKTFGPTAATTDDYDLPIASQKGYFGFDLSTDLSGDCFYTQYHNDTMVLRASHASASTLAPDQWRLGRNTNVSAPDNFAGTFKYFAASRANYSEAIGIFDTFLIEFTLVHEMNRLWGRAETLA